VCVCVCVCVCVFAYVYMCVCACVYELRAFLVACREEACIMNRHKDACTNPSTHTQRHTLA
jgi:hypothetical protein